MAQVGAKTIIGGAFTSVGIQPRNHVAAIRADGTVDPSFTPGVDGTVYALAGSADGTPSSSAGSSPAPAAPPGRRFAT